MLGTKKAFGFGYMVRKAASGYNDVMAIDQGSIPLER
jgi:hypothetical protein